MCALPDGGSSHLFILLVRQFVVLCVKRTINTHTVPAIYMRPLFYSFLRQSAACWYHGMENGNTENGSMEERENGNGTPSGDVGSEVVLADKGEGETEVVTCMESEEGLELGMEICTYDSMGMGLEGDEEILTASSLEHVASCREGGGERTLETPPLSSPRDKLTLPNPREYLTLPGHRLHIDEQIYTEDSSTMEESSQVSQSDSLYCLSHASSMTSLTSDVGRTEEEDREEVGGANKELSDEGGGGGGRRRKGGKREVKKVKGRSFGQKAVDSRKLTSKVRK